MNDIMNGESGYRLGCAYNTVCVHMFVSLVTPNPGADHEPNLATAAQIVAEMLTHMFNGF
jgi:hypothetical protein